MSSRSLLRQAGWLVGAPLAIFRFLRRAVPVVEVDADRARPDSGLAARGDGIGPVIRRLYRVAIREPKLTAERLVAIIAADPNVVAPSEVVRFEKTRGAPGRLEEGDELLIRMAGPWNAPVRVVGRWPEGFRLAAARGHPQLGAVELRARDEDRAIVLEIQTLERAAGVTFHLLQRMGLVRRMQRYTWAEILENSAQIAGGARPEQITVASLTRT